MSAMVGRCQFLPLSIVALSASLALFGFTAESGATWFEEVKPDSPIIVSDEHPFGYEVPLGYEQTKSSITIKLRMFEIAESELDALDISNRQAGIVRIANGGTYNYAVLADGGWKRVRNAKATPEDGAEVVVKVSICYYLNPCTVEYNVDGVSLKDGSGNFRFACPQLSPRPERFVSIGASGCAEISSWSGEYSFLNSTAVKVAAGTTLTYTGSSLPSSNGKTFRVVGGGTLKIPHGKFPSAGTADNLHVDKGSSVVFEFTGKSSLSPIIKLFNGTFDSSMDQLSFLVADEGVSRLSKLMLSGDGKGLEAHVAEIPSMGAVSANGVTVTTAVPGFWYGLEYAALLSDTFLLDADSVQTPTKTGPLKLSSSAAPTDAGFYRVSVTREKP